MLAISQLSVLVMSAGCKDNVIHALVEQDLATPEHGNDDARSRGIFSLSEPYFIMVLVPTYSTEGETCWPPRCLM
jgi:hypothetical protein